MNDSVNTSVNGALSRTVRHSLPSRAPADQGAGNKGAGKGTVSLSPSTPTSSTSTREQRPDMDGPNPPTRIQLRRTAGWRKPAGAIVVARPTRWGNPFRLNAEIGGLVRYGPQHLERFSRPWDFEGRCSAPGTRHDMWFASDDIVETHIRWATRAEVVELFRLTLTEPTPGMRMAYPSRQGRFARFTIADARAELAGHDLACWCPLDEPCHADVLLEVANA